MSTETVDAALARLAARQFGVFSRGQALPLGATARMIQRRCDAGRWLRVGHGIYAIAGHPLSWNSEMFMALLSAGAGSAASHRAAARLWRFPDCSDAAVEITHPTYRGRRDFIAHRSALHRRDVTHIGEIPVTSPARTLIDLAAVVPDATVGAALDDALRRRLITIPRLMRRADALAQRGRRGIEVVRAAAADRDGLPALLQSPLESAVYDLIVTSGLPRPIPQCEILLGARRAFIDFAYPDAMFGIEADGYRWHAGRDVWQSDLARRNALTSAGWRILHVTDEDVKRRRDGVVDAIRSGLAAYRTPVTGSSI